MAAHLYWRVTVSAIQSGTLVRIYEIEMRGSKGGADQCTGGTATASTTNGVNVASRAFDNSTSLFWEATGATGWVRYQFAAPVDVIEYAITALATGGPTSWTLEWSDDGTAWTTADTVTLGVAWPSAVVARVLTTGTTDERITQAAALVLIADDSDGRVTQAAILALTSDSPGVRATQAAVLVLHNDEAAERVTQVAVLALVHETPCLQQLCQCWTITRQDGTVYRFTTHDEAVVLQGQTFQPCESLQATATSGGLVANGVGDVQLKGLITDDSITARDLFGGMFDGAIVEVWEAQWGDAERGFIPRRLAKGVLGEITQGDTHFRAEMLSPGARLQQRPLLNTHTPACRWNLGDGRCPVNIEALRVSGTVGALSAKNVLQRSDYRMFYDAARVEADAYFADGEITWTSGDNAGLRSEVRTNEAGWVTLWAPMPYPIGLLDTYTLTPGCTKTTDDHTVKFGLDMVDFGGFPHLPGNDAILQTPNAKG